MIIVEGSDGAGKTHLIDRLSKDLGLPVQPKVMSSEMQPTVDLAEWVEADLKKGFGPRLYDRHRLISELIYGPVFRSEGLDPGFDQPEWLKKQLKEFTLIQPIIIICMPPLQAVIDNVKSDDRNRVVKRQINTIYWLYYIWVCQNYTALQPWVWDYTKLESEANVKYVQMLRRIRVRLSQGE